MKIIKYPNGTAWWIGQRLTCQSCWAIIELEHEEEKKVQLDERGLGIQCPFCMTLLRLEHGGGDE